MSLRTVGKYIRDHLPSDLERKAQYFFDALPEKIRFGREISCWDQFLEESENWDRESLLNYQKEKVEELVKWATKHVPYYREISHQVKADEGIKSFPVLSKETVKLKKSLMIADNVSPSGFEADRTSGSTGIPLNFFISKQQIAKERAFWKRLLRWGGFCHKKDKLLTIRGLLGNYNNGKPVRSRYIRADRHLLLSTAGLTDESILYYLTTINEFEPQVISVFPSVLHLIATYVKRNKLGVFSPKFIYTSSETLFPEMRQEIEAAFNCKVLNWYGLNERCITAQECPEFNNMHINMEYGYMEVLEDRQLGHGRGYLLGTGFDNFVMPFIRYNTLDVGRISDEYCPCGRQSLLLKDLEGRIDDFIITADGRYLPPAFFGVIMKTFSKVQQFQVLQARDTRIRMNVQGADIDSEDISEIIRMFDTHLGESIDIEIVERLQRTSQGKIRRIISELEK